MKLKFTILICTCLFSLQPMAQKPFRLKLIGYFQNPDSSIETDTLYVGFDSLGAEGYQQGLDVIDTSYGINRWHIKDTLTQRLLNTTSPYNTQKSIKAFAYNQRVYWQTYYTGILVGIKYDTTELLYQDGSIRRSYAGLSCDGCSFDVWENDAAPLGPFIQNGQPFFYTDSIEILEAFNELNVYVYLVDTLRSGIPEARSDLTMASPNPAVDCVTLTFRRKVSGSLTLMDVSGLPVLKSTITNSSDFTLDVGSLHTGCYFLMFTPDDATQAISATKLMKY